MRSHQLECQAAWQQLCRRDAICRATRRWGSYRQMLQDGITCRLCGSRVGWKNNDRKIATTLSSKNVKRWILQPPPSYGMMHIWVFPPQICACSCRNLSQNVFSLSLTKRSAGAEGIWQLSLKVKVTTAQAFNPRSSQSVKNTHTQCLSYFFSPPVSRCCPVFFYCKNFRCPQDIGDLWQFWAIRNSSGGLAGPSRLHWRPGIFWIWSSI